MRLGAPVAASNTPEEWIKNLKDKGYRAAYCPVGTDAPDTLIEEYRLAALEHDIVIAEVGAWCNNPMSANPDTARAGIAGTIAALTLAEKIGARCCVNVAGSVGEPWDGPHPDNFSTRSFDRLVSVIRQVVDAVSPTRTCFALEPMPHMLPSSPEEISALIRAVDRPGFAVHLDTVNMINSIDRYYRSGDFTRRCFEQVGEHIRVVHVKDCRITGKLPVSILEIPLGEGEYDLASLIACARDHRDADLPLLLEHLPDLAAFDKAAAHFRRVAEEQGVRV